MSQALANHEDYIIAQPGTSKATLDAQLENLHDELYKQLNANTSQAQSSVIMPDNTPPGESVAVDGTFYGSGTTWSYQIDYNTTSDYPDLDVWQYAIQQTAGTATSYLDHCNWNGQNWYFNDQVIPTSSNAYAGQTNMYWTNPPGYQYTTIVVENNVSYSGWATLS